jgi:protein-disulfide isomerase
MSKLSAPVSAEDHSQGDSNAKCTLIEYGDYECRSCGQADSIVKRLQKHFGKDLSFVFRNFPLSEVHPNAEHAAEAAEFAAASGKFWDLHDLLFQNQQKLEDDSLRTLVGRLQLSGNDLGEALNAGTYRPRVESDFTGGVHSGVNGTPTFFVDGGRYDGSWDYETLAATLQQQINST